MEQNIANIDSNSITNLQTTVENKVSQNTTDISMPDSQDLSSNNDRNSTINQAIKDQTSSTAISTKNQVEIPTSKMIVNDKSCTNQFSHESLEETNSVLINEHVQQQFDSNSAYTKPLTDSDQIETQKNVASVLPKSSSQCASNINIEIKSDIPAATIPPVSSDHSFINDNNYNVKLQDVSTTQKIDQNSNQNISSISSTSTSSSSSTCSSINGSKMDLDNVKKKRPMNAFLMFCKRHRSLVKEKNPQLENRGITKILGDWWSRLDKSQKSCYIDLARQHKNAFMEANPDYKWVGTDSKISHQPITSATVNNNSNPEYDSAVSYKNPSLKDPVLLKTSASAKPMKNPISECNNKETPMHIDNQISVSSSVITPHSETTSSSNDISTSHKMDILGQDPSLKKDEALSPSDSQSANQLGAPKPPKKRYLENGHHNQESSSENLNSSTSLNKKKLQKDPVLTKEKVVPFPLDQDTLERVVEHCYNTTSKQTHSKPAENITMHQNLHTNSFNPMLDGTNCFIPSLQFINQQPLVSNFPPSVYLQTMLPPVGASLTTLPTVSTQRPSYNVTAPNPATAQMTLSNNFPKKIENNDEPVDFSMNRTITTNRQKIINNLVEKMLSTPDEIVQSRKEDEHRSSAMHPHQTSIQVTAPKNNNFHYTYSNPLRSNMVTAQPELRKNVNSLRDFNLEKRLIELPLFELNTKLEDKTLGQMDGLATLAEAAFLTQKSTASNRDKHGSRDS